MKLMQLFKIANHWINGKDPVYELYFKNKKTLDLGSGEGKMIGQDPNLISGIDINLRQVEKLTQRGFNVVHGSATALPFAEDKFDAVNCSHLIEHLTPDQARLMFIEIKRVLKRNGVLVITTPTPIAVWNTFGHVKPYTPTAIRKLFKEVSLESFDSIQGFKLEQVVYLGRWSTNKLTFIVSTFLSNIFNITSVAGACMMIIKKYEN